MYEFEVQELEEATNGFSSSRLIGKGSHGSVYKGILKDGSHLAIKKQSLALQKLHDNTKLDNESLILSSIPPNPYVINFLGVGHDSSDNSRIIVTEYMANGTLHQLLHSSPTPPPWRMRLEIALRLAKGLCFLHDSNPPILHRDIKSANLLFDQNWNVKLADFGLAMQLMHGQTQQAKLPAGTIGYIDPSYTTPSKVSTKIDVFSYGVVLLELISRRKAIDMSKSPPSLVEWALPLITKGRALQVCDKALCFSQPTLTQLAARCLSSDQSIRPSMSQVVEDLENLMIEPVHHQFPWSMNYIREMVGWMMRRRRKSEYSGECRVIKTSGRACVEDNDHTDCGVPCNNISKGVRKILADITFK